MPCQPVRELGPTTVITSGLHERRYTRITVTGFSPYSKQGSGRNRCPGYAPQFRLACSCNARGEHREAKAQAHHLREDLWITTLQHHIRRDALHRQRCVDDLTRVALARVEQPLRSIHLSGSFGRAVDVQLLFQDGLRAKALRSHPVLLYR